MLTAPDTVGECMSEYASATSNFKTVSFVFLYLASVYTDRSSINRLRYGTRAA